MLGAYEDSDEEDAGNRSAANSQHNQSTDIDSTLANFMAVSILRPKQKNTLNPIFFLLIVFELR